MTHFLFDLLSNLALLVLVLTVCHLCNRLIPGASLIGPYVFIPLAFAAFVLDTVLTFLVFADAQSRYGQFSSSAAFFERACAYWLAIVVAFIWRVVTRGSHATKASSSETLVIHTSPYSESHLPM